jgi:CRISPR-associated protein Cmr6
MHKGKKDYQGTSNEPRVKVKGKVWFGNKGFYSGDVVEEHNREDEDEAKKKFFDRAWEKAEMNIMDSPSLLFQKYLPFTDEAKIEKKKRDGRTETKDWLNFKDEPISGDSKKLFLDKIVRYEVLFGKVREFSEFFKKRVDKQKENLKNQHYEIILDDYKLKTASRLVVGLGAGHVLETSLTLHHIFGIPYIPGSALKGVVRMVNFWEIAEKLNKKSDEDIEKLQKQLYNDENSNSDKNVSDKNDILKHKLLFGTQNFKGLLVFLDAYPEIQIKQQIFELDVMTPHYQGYYTKNQVPGDWENPNPIPFLTVKKGITFCFNVLFDKLRAERILTLKDDEFPNANVAKEIIKEWLSNDFSKISQDVKEWIEEALTEFGVGAKTRLGYGIFE